MIFQLVPEELTDPGPVGTERCSPRQLPAAQCVSVEGQPGAVAEGERVGAGGVWVVEFGDRLQGVAVEEQVLVVFRVLVLGDGGHDAAVVQEAVYYPPEGQCTGGCPLFPFTGRTGPHTAN